MTVRNKQELEGFLKGMVKRKELIQEQADGILANAKMTEHHSAIHAQTVISTEAFPSIIKSAANYYVNQTHDTKTVKPLVPYIEGDGDCRDVLYLHHFKTLPYPEVEGQFTHMIHIEGSSATGLLYAMMEYYSIYVYIVVIDRNYNGNDVNMTYTYDVVAGQEVSRDFSLSLTMKDLEDFRKLQHEEYVKYLPYIQKRADAVLGIWQKKSLHDELHEVIENAFAKFPEGDVMTPEKMAVVQKDVMEFIERVVSRRVDC